MATVFIQARMGSSRLPGKVLKEIAGKPQLLLMIERIRPAAMANRIIVLTSDLPADDVIEKFCAGHKVECYRGSEWDVLDRFYTAAKNAGLGKKDTLLRVTADCPLHHHKVIDFAIKEFVSGTYDYFGNSFPPGYEDGIDTEVFTFETLERTWHEADLLSQREHVTTFIKDSGLFRCGFKKYHPRYHYKLSVDTLPDHAAAEKIVQHFLPRTDFSMEEVVELLEKDPSIVQINSSSVINEGYKKSLANDRKIR